MILCQLVRAIAAGIDAAIEHMSPIDHGERDCTLGADRRPFSYDKLVVDAELDRILAAHLTIYEAADKLGGLLWELGAYPDSIAEKPRDHADLPADVEADVEIPEPPEEAGLFVGPYESNGIFTVALEPQRSEREKIFGPYTYFPFDDDWM